jgi:hypothetical protein
MKTCNKNILTVLLMTFVFLTIVSLDGVSQNCTTKYFSHTQVLRPFVSEIRSSAIKLETGYINKLDGYYFVEDFTYKPFIETNLGAILPGAEVLLDNQKTKFIADMYVGLNVLVDLFGPPTAAVINTDYSFGIRTGVLTYFDSPIIQNAGILFIPIMHESTHIGDEFSLRGYQKFDDFKRINLSHESWELAFVLNDPDTIKSNLLSLKFGIQSLLNHSDGYYKYDSLEVKGADVPYSKSFFEAYVQINAQRSNGFLCSSKWKQVFSAEFRNRAKFSYVYNIPETRSWNCNIYLGWMHTVNSHGKNIGFFLRYYSGIIPYGQMRNTGGFRFTGFSLVYN